MSTLKTYLRAGLLLSPLIAPLSYSMGDDDPLITSLAVDKIEVTEEATSWDLELSSGHDINGLIAKLEGEKPEDGSTEHHAELLYNRALAPYWDGLVGLAHSDSGDDRHTSLVMGFAGDAPYFIETEAKFYLSEEDQTRLTLKVEKEILLSRKWLLIPELEIELYGQQQQEQSIGSGLAHSEMSVRLKYLVTKSFHPYIGIVQERAHGNTASMIRGLGESTSESTWVVGFSFSL